MDVSEKAPVFIATCPCEQPITLVDRATLVACGLKVLLSVIL